VAAMGTAALGPAVKGIRASLEAKTSLIDAFKAQNSLFKNSPRYVPTAHKDIQARMKSEREIGAERHHGSLDAAFRVAARTPVEPLQVLAWAEVTSDSRRQISIVVVAAFIV